MSAKTRLNLDITPKAKEALQDLQERTEAASLIEVIRRAVALYDLVVSQTEKGNAFFVRREDGTEMQIIIL